MNAYELYLAMVLGPVPSHDLTGSTPAVLAHNFHGMTSPIFTLMATGPETLHRRVFRTLPSPWEFFIEKVHFADVPARNGQSGSPLEDVMFAARRTNHRFHSLSNKHPEKTGLPRFPIGSCCFDAR